MLDATDPKCECGAPLLMSSDGNGMLFERCADGCFRRAVTTRRPTCPECGKIVHPTQAVPFGEAPTLPERVLEGIYDSSDCLLDARRRGYPKDRARRA